MDIDMLLTNYYSIGLENQPLTLNFVLPITKNTTGIRGIYITITSTTMVFANEKNRFTTITSTTITFTITNFTANIFLNYYKYFKIIS